MIQHDRNLLLWFLLAILAQLALNSIVCAEDTATVTAILDGDTIEVLNKRHPERIRLNGIDCPEKGQAYGHRAKEAASNLVFGIDVTLQTHGKDKYGRTIADVLLPDGTNINQKLVKEGWCWWYRKYAATDAELERLEREAREAKKGLWQDPAPVPPWMYRKMRRGQALDLSDLVPLDTTPASDGSSRGPPILGAAGPDAFPSVFQIIGNRRSHIYHRPDCPNYSQVSTSHRVPFNSEAEAEAAGYRRARNCP